MIIEIIKSLILARFITKFEVIGWCLDTLPSGLPKWILVVLTSCFKCASFWTSLIITHDIFIAAGTSILAEIIYSIEQKITTRNVR